MGMTVNQAGRLGGLAVLKNRGREHFAEIGARGQKAMRARYPNMVKQWGKLGGRPRKPSFSAYAGMAPARGMKCGRPGKSELQVDMGENGK